MQTTQLLAILEDLTRMQEILHSSVCELFEAKIKEAGGDVECVEAIIREIDSRFELMSRPCVEAVSRKV